MSKNQKNPGRLTVARLTVHDVLGIQDSTIDLSTITVLEGDNGQTKSSHLKALRSALGIDRTSLARMARIKEDGTPADEPYVEVLLVGEGEQAIVRKKGGNSAEVEYRVEGNVVPIKKPVEWLRDIVNAQTAMPAVWLQLDDEAKASAVLEAMPLSGYDRAAALATAGLEGFRLPPIPAGLHPLEELEQIEAAVFASRTQVHKDESDEHRAAEKLLSGIPAEAPASVEAEILKLSTAVDSQAADVARADEAAAAAEAAAEKAARAAHSAVEERVKSGFKAGAQQLRVDHERQAAEIRAEAEKRIAELAAKVDDAVEALRAKGNDELQKADAACETALKAARAARETARETIEGQKRALAESREKLAALRAQQQSIETDRHVRATAAEAEKKAREHHARAKKLSDAIDALKRYRLELAEKLPVKGLAVKFDEKGRKSLTLDGVALGQINDGRLVQLATEVSLLRSANLPKGGPYLPLVMLDGLQDLSPARREALLREIASRGNQVIAAVTTGEPLRVLRPEVAATA